MDVSNPIGLQVFIEFRQRKDSRERETKEKGRKTKEHWGEGPGDRSFDPEINGVRRYLKDLTWV